MMKRLLVMLALLGALAVTIPLVNAPRAQAAAIDVSATREHDIRLAVNRYVAAAAVRKAPYCSGGTGPSCYDCSGLVYAAYRAAGLTLPVRTSTQMRSWTTATSLRYARTGDLLLYSGHVELVYKVNGVGPAYAIGAHTYGTPVKITPIRMTGLLKVGRVVR